MQQSSPQNNRVAVTDQVAIFRQGLLAAMAAAGFEPVWDDSGGCGEDGRPPPAVLLITIRSELDWDLLKMALKQRAASLTVALLETPEEDDYLQAIRLGANGVVRCDAPIEELLFVVHAAQRQHLVLPQQHARSIAARAVHPCNPDWITDDEKAWLLLLSRGCTVQTLADKSGYSERSMYRRLHSLYGRMGVTNRTEAVLWASRRGLIEC